MISEQVELGRINIEKEIYISARADTVFASILEQIGEGFTHPDGTPMAMKVEAWPGGRWYRDLGNNAGHFWGHVQVIKPPSLLELVGPMFMSYPVMSHVQYRLSEQNGTTLLSLKHRAVGDISPDHLSGVHKGWDFIIERIRQRASR